ncbi:hypothetical protein [Desulfonema magnum]|uniref:Uncharacterized protein n=1 Tax=Desulfonema magnum TaxID=45655 RepID=A0A975BPI1_9BACT|nr:hypothetical protein [Desulfonema magnum]QTA88794.1 Uncharacterized protein dnm_048410 [Desulfonema magnum]
MAAAAPVYLSDRFTRLPEHIIGELSGIKNETEGKRPKPFGKRVRAGAKHSFETIVSEMSDEAEKKDPERKKEWAGLADRDRKQIRYLAAEAKKHGVRIIIVCDFIHTPEYLWEAGHAFFCGV